MRHRGGAVTSKPGYRWPVVWLPSTKLTLRTSASAGVGCGYKSSTDSVAASERPPDATPVRMTKFVRAASPGSGDSPVGR